MEVKSESGEFEGLSGQRFPYKTDLMCLVCDKAHMECTGWFNHHGGHCQRKLVCPRCEAEETDRIDSVTLKVIFTARTNK